MKERKLLEQKMFFKEEMRKERLLKDHKKKKFLNLKKF